MQHTRLTLKDRIFLLDRTWAESKTINKSNAVSESLMPILSHCTEFLLLTDGIIYIFYQKTCWTKTLPHELMKYSSSNFMFSMLMFEKLKLLHSLWTHKTEKFQEKLLQILYLERSLTCHTYQFPFHFFNFISFVNIILILVTKT